ncbi:MAG: DoxX family protein [Phycisphaerales bacterium]
MICNREMYRNLGLLVLRLGIGTIMAAAHGWGKITAGPELWGQVGSAAGLLGVPASLFVVFGFMAAFSEFGASILLALGLFTRVAAFLLLSTMTVAFIMHTHNHDPFDAVASHPLELAIVYLSLLLIGPGRFAVDALLFKKRG